MDDPGGSALRIRAMRREDRAIWLEMRVALWPEETRLAHDDMIDRMLADEVAWAFMAETAPGSSAAFAEVTLRKFANGCETRPVPFLEGIWVRDGLRRQRVGAALIRFIEAFLTERGYRELGSDTQIDNLASQAAHVDWGFSETERVVYYRKDLTKAAQRL
jgi:aminoglycoside 6'-N-acetyltransferase I